MSGCRPKGSRDLLTVEETDQQHPCELLYGFSLVVLYAFHVMLLERILLWKQVAS